MFIDRAEIEVHAGDGGNGAVAFRHEKYVPNGGPSGGDGGRGGNVIARVDRNMSTLLDFRYKRVYKAGRGGDGQNKDMFGKNGADLVLVVPPGTLILDADTDEVVADLDAEVGECVVARGGSGGRGNTHFTSSTHQTPRFSEKGEPGEHLNLVLELRLLADVGLVGLPNVGKSTIISAISAARPKIANYPFTTLVPNLGVVGLGPGHSFVVADLPGLIAGANEGVGLGHEFLRHVQRTRVLTHVIDCSGLTGRDPWEDYQTILREVELYDATLLERPQLVALSKVDLLGPDDDLRPLEAKFAAVGLRTIRTSGATREGLAELVQALWNIVRSTPRTRQTPADDGVAVIRAPRTVDTEQWEVVGVSANHWRITGARLERLVARSDMGNEHALRRVQRSLDRAGVTEKLRELGAADGDTVEIGGIELEYADDEMLGNRGRRRSRSRGAGLD